MRLSRGCYDKYHRCPGWVGGGPRYAKVHRCDNGHIQVDYDAVLWKWRFWPCNTCDVVVWPWMTRWLSPWQWWHGLRRWARDEVDFVVDDWRWSRRSGVNIPWSLWLLVVSECRRLPKWLRLRRVYARLWGERQQRHWRRWRGQPAEGDSDA